MAVTVSPQEFTFVSFDAGAIEALLAGLLDRLGMGDRALQVEINEASPVVRITAERRRPDRDPGRQRRLRGAPPAPLAVGGQRRRPTPGASCCACATGSDGGFADAPAEDDLTLAQIAAWDTYSVGRLGRLGYHVHQPRWRYNFRNRHGFTDATDAAFDRIWGADRLTWAELRADLRRRAASVRHDRAPPDRPVDDRDPHPHRPRQRRPPRPARVRARPTGPSSSCRTASPRARGRGATSSRCSAPPAGTPSPPTSAATAASSRPAEVEAYGTDSPERRPPRPGRRDRPGAGRVRRARLGRADRLGPHPAPPRAGPGGRRRQRAVHRLARPDPRDFRQRFGDRFFYILYFQEVGPAERELEADVRRTMHDVLWSASAAGADREPISRPAEGTGFLDVMGEWPDDAAAVADRRRPRPVRRRRSRRRASSGRCRTTGTSTPTGSG